MPASVVEEAMRSCSLATFAIRPQCQSLVSPWVTRLASLMWCMAKTIAEALHA